MGNQGLPARFVDLEQTRDGILVVAQDLRVQSPPEAIDACEEVEDQSLAAGGDALVHL